MAEVQDTSSKPGLYTCTTCGQVKAHTEYYMEKRTKADGTPYVGRRTQCKTCFSKARKGRVRPSRAKAARNGKSKQQAVNADHRSTQSATSAAGYHFDKDTIHKLTRIAKVLDREGWRNETRLASVDNQQLSAAGMYLSDVQILRKAVSVRDPDLCHFIFDEPLVVPPVQPVSVPTMVATLAQEPPLPPVVKPQEVWTPEYEAEVALAQEPTLDSAVQPVSDMDIEAAAEMIVACKAQVTFLEGALREYEDRCRSIREQIEDQHRQRANAIALLRRAPLT